MRLAARAHHIDRCAGEAMTRFKTVRFTAMAIAALLCSCSHQPLGAPESAYPVAIDPDKVGHYPALAKSGGGYVYDEVLEYRVWINADGDDYYYAFANYEDAKDYSEKTERAEEPLVLVLQHEHINEPEPGKYEHITGDRITEWRVEWLEGNKRRPDTIANFLRKNAKQPAQQSPGGDGRKDAPQE
jgi:putative acetyltransferase